MGDWAEGEGGREPHNRQTSYLSLLYLHLNWEDFSGCTDSPIHKKILVGNMNDKLLQSVKPDDLPLKSRLKEREYREV